MRRWKSLAAALCTAVLLCGFSVPSYAYADGEAGSGYGDPMMETPVPTPEPTIEPSQGLSEEGGFVTHNLLYDENTNKQFITVRTNGGATFYFVIGYDRPVGEEGEQYETYFLNMVDEADLLAAAKAAGAEQAVCSCSEKCEMGAVNTECAVYSVNMGECVDAAPEPVETKELAEEPETGDSMGTLLLILAMAGISGGATSYFRVLRSEQQQAAEPERDYGEEDYEDDSPPWDEDENSEEDEEWTLPITPMKK